MDGGCFTLRCSQSCFATVSSQHKNVYSLTGDMSFARYLLAMPIAHRLKCKMTFEVGLGPAQFKPKHLFSSLALCLQHMDWDFGLIAQLCMKQQHRVKSDSCSS